MRENLIDWVLEVIDQFRISNETFYNFINILDSVLINYSNKLSIDEIQLIGIVTLFIASKSEDLNPFFISNITNQICHNKFNPNEIIEKELQILTQLDFELFK